MTVGRRRDLDRNREVTGIQLSCLGLLGHGPGRHDQRSFAYSRLALLTWPRCRVAAPRAAGGESRDSDD